MVGKRAYFMRTDRVLFSTWTPEDLSLAQVLWGDPGVTRYICESGRFAPEEIEARLETEIRRQTESGAQYWPIFAAEFAAEDEGFLGCCGLRPWPDDESAWELGVHLLPAHWGKGLAPEAARASMAYAFDTLGADRVYAGHHPDNAASAKVLTRLGFTYMMDSFYAPTGLYHPAYVIDRR
ncbi:GNAT family N-acetyltransferase [Eubacteriales bacterium OttesenSCG-928-A19]|nr:GNAT family N-acetyltransferase [Eubacteriales bacterium OttesenSCG-928-A19]